MMRAVGFYKSALSRQTGCQDNKEEGEGGKKMEEVMKEELRENEETWYRNKIKERRAKSRTTWKSEKRNKEHQS